MLLALLFCLIFGAYIYTNRDIRAFDKLKKSPNIIECQNFIKKYPDSPKKSEVIGFIKELYNNELSLAYDSLRLEKFINKYSSNYRYMEEYKRPFLNKAIELLNIEKEWLEKRRLAKIKREKEQWKTEYSAWKTATAMNTLDAYQQYLKLYPNGRHHTQAQQKVIDLEVANVFASGNYGRLPSMDRVSNINSAYSSVYISNDTQYNLTLLYSGIESKRVIISPRQSTNIKLKSGTYRIVASVNASGVQNFAGQENLTGGSYSVSYYIQTSRY